MTYDPLSDSAVTATTPDANSYWKTTCTPPDFNRLSTDISTDYLVIGAGYTGLSAALTLAEANQDVTLIDARHSGFGCAGRNAGFVLNGTGRLGIPAISKKWGNEIGQGMAQEFKAAVTLLTDRIDRHNIDCDLTAGDYYKIAHSRRQAKLQHAQASDSVRFVDKPALLNEFGLSGAHGALVQPGQTLNPLKLAAGLARAADAERAKICMNTPAKAIKHSKNHYYVQTPKGKIRAKNLLLATNAYSPATFHHAIDNRQFPVQSSIIVTQPLSAQQRADTGLDGPLSMMDTRMMKYYYRTLPDGRVLFGGRGAVKGNHAQHPQEKARMVRALCDSFPALSGIGVDYFWSGWVSVALDSLPRIHVDDSGHLGYAMGYCGSGVSFAGLAGTRLAQRMMGGDAASDINTDLPLYSSPLPRYPFAGLRRLGLRALYNWAKVVE
ncbi:NAD(P)/FAD-dependent oxidoreductase [Alteromonas halophila]|uniref:FAD-dependent oxidoreductase n=1 Tax=Alteromonas halophila TaxID=516698 RepID=A0A918JRJ4_9ALTE|nr:FAD-binding oxidoreductase [Alteromonas halophila]GGW92783.1 FAD-dependent oxidoreductase [Alteromonas halophila]